MKSNGWLLLAAGLIATLGITPGFAHDTKPNAVTEALRASLTKFRSDYIGAVLDGKPEVLSSYYADNIRLMPEYQKTILGKTNVFSYHKAFGARFLVHEYVREEREIIDLGSKVVEIGGFTMKLALRSTGKEQELVGKYLDLWEKSENGQLALITEAWNYNHQVTIADELRFENVPAVQIAFQGHLPVDSNISFELAALNRLLEVVVTQHDAKTWSRFYADDGMFIYSQHPIFVGRKALDEFLQEHCKQLPVFEHLDIRNDRIDESDGYVIEYASHIANWRNGDSSGVNTGKDIRLWRREPDGSLKLFRAMGMYD